MKSTSSAKKVASYLATGEWTIEAVAADLHAMTGGRKPLGIKKLCVRLFAFFGTHQRPDAWELAMFLASQRSFYLLKITQVDRERPSVMRPADGPPTSWTVPAITTTYSLEKWLGLQDHELHFLRNSWRRDEASSPKADHYRRIVIPRGQRTPRLIEAPFPRLKLVQTHILEGILNRVPLHDAACGFCKGRSISHHVSPHTGQRCVVRMDVKDFFPTITRARVYRVFLSIGYPTEVAAALADLCTTSTPREIRNSLKGTTWSDHQRLRERHLPQGAPTSPALANLCAFSLDRRLSGLASAFHARYTRYADDLLFSGDDSFRRDASRFTEHVAMILLDEGFTPSHRKTKIMPAATRQYACGLVINEKQNVPREQRELLEAILTNCVRHGPHSQNREGHDDFRAHLQGRIGHIAQHHPSWGEKLKVIFDDIIWH